MIAGVFFSSFMIFAKKGYDIVYPVVVFVIERITQFIDNIKKLYNDLFHRNAQFDEFIVKFEKAWFG